MRLRLEILTSRVCSSSPALFLLLQMGCLGNARWAPCRTDPTFRSHLLCSSVCRMSCGISWHKVSGGAWGKSLRPCREGCQVELPSGPRTVCDPAGPGWAEEEWDQTQATGSEYQDGIPCTHAMVPRLPSCLTASPHGRALVAGWHHPVCDLSGDGAHPPPPPATLAGAGGQGQVGQRQQSSMEQRGLSPPNGIRGGTSPFTQVSYPSALCLRGSCLTAASPGEPH